MRIHRNIFTSSNTQNNTISLSLDGGKLPLVLDLSQFLPFFVIGAYGIYLIRKSEWDKMNDCWKDKWKEI